MTRALQTQRKFQQNDWNNLTKVLRLQIPREREDMTKTRQDVEALGRQSSFKQFQSPTTVGTIKIKIALKHNI